MVADSHFKRAQLLVCIFMHSEEDGDVNWQSAGEYDAKRLGTCYGCDNWNLWYVTDTAYSGQSVCTV
jgi:hypothetical protein